MKGSIDRTTFTRVCRGVLLALVLVIIIFAIYEMVERTWLHAVDESTRQFLHQVRGLLSSLVAAVFVGWFVTRAASPFGVGTLSTDQWIEGRRPNPAQRMIDYMRWFVVMRWVAIAVILAFVVFAVRIANLLPEQVWRPIMATTALLAALNVFYTVMIRLGYGLQYALPVQAYADLVILVLLLHFSGGIENPLSPLMLFHVIIAGIVLSRGQCYSVAVAGSLLFTLMALGEWAEVIPHYELITFPHPVIEGHTLHAAHEAEYVLTRLGLHTLILLLTAYFVTTLADRIRGDEDQLHTLAGRALSQRQLLEQAMEVTATGLCVCDESHKPYLINQHWRSWFGETCGKELSESERASSVTAAHGDDQTWSIELKIPGPQDNNALRNGKDQGGRYFRVTTARVLDESGQVKHFASLAQDITAQKRAQEQMVRAGKLAAVGELAGQMAHEINNPIGIVNARVRLLRSRRRGEMSAKVAEDLECVGENVDRVARITGGLLSYCRPGGTGRARIDLRSPVRKALELIAPQSRESPIRIHDNLGDRRLPVRANADELQQVFLNLFINSLDAMSEGGRLTVTAAVRDSNNESKEFDILIKDTGAGIKPEVLDRIFEPFFTSKPEGKGTGLGLSVCHGLVRSHGGRIEVKSQPGSGTEVTVSLPAENTMEVV